MKYHPTKVSRAKDLLVRATYEREWTYGVGSGAVLKRWAGFVFLLRLPWDISMLFYHVTMPPGGIFERHSASIATNVGSGAGTNKAVGKLAQSCDVSYALAMHMGI